MGMTDRQRLFRIELPLAAPIIMAGVRTAAVWTIGAATLATPVGQTSLGNYIFSGLQTENWVYVLFGCAASAVLALATDQLLGLIESGLARREAWRLWVGAIGLVVGALAALSPLRGHVQPRRLPGRREELLRAVHPRRSDGRPAPGRWSDGVDQGGPRLRHRLPRARRGRDRRLRRLFRHALGQCARPQGQSRSRRRAPGADHRVEAPGWCGRAGAARLRERLCPRHAAGSREIPGDRRHRRSRPPCADPEAGLGPRVPLPPGMEGDPDRLRPDLREDDVLPADLHVPRPRNGRGGRDLGVFERRPDRRRAPDRTDGPPAGPPALRRRYPHLPAKGGRCETPGALAPLVGKISVEAMRAANYSVDRDDHKLGPAQAARQLGASLR